MTTIKDQLNIIKDVFKKKDNDIIIKTITGIHPIILMYYQMIDSKLDYYIDKLPKEYFNFDIDDAIDIFIKIGDASFVTYIIKKCNLYVIDFLQTDRRTKGSKIIEEMIDYYIEMDDINNLNIIHENNKYFGSYGFNTTKIIIDNCIVQNKPKILELFIMDHKNNDIDDAEPENFKGYICSHIMFRGDLVDIVKIFHEYSKTFPDFINFDFNLVFNAALVNGRERCMLYALDNSLVDYYYEEEGEGFTTVNGIYPFTDTIMYAIIGKNINCVRRVFNMFMNKSNNIIKENYWEQYFKFAAVYGTVEIIKYMITIKPYLIEQIEDFYNNILKFALCDANIDIVKFAVNNGATFSNSIHYFVKDYNNGRSPEELPIDEDYIDFYMKKYKSPEDFDIKYMECMEYIHKN
jgi:hypothetical protein